MLADPITALSTYGELRRRLSEVLVDVDDAKGAATVVPGCPAWSVTDAVAHLAGACIDIVEGNLDGVGTAAWADHQVERFSPLGLAGLLERWGEVGPVVEAAAPAFPERSASQFVFDATTHEQDIRGALGRPGGRDADSVRVSLGFLAAALDAIVRGDGLPTLEVTTADWSAVAGDGEPAVTLRTSSFEALRTFGGRRSTEQFLAMDWSAGGADYLAIFDSLPLELRAEALVE